MGPVEIVFIAVWLLFGFIGLVRGVWKELGVTVMLFIGLLFLQVAGRAVCEILDYVSRNFHAQTRLTRRSSAT